MKIKHLITLSLIFLSMSFQTYSQKLKVDINKIEKVDTAVSISFALVNSSPVDTLVIIENNWIEENHCGLDANILEGEDAYPYVLLYRPKSRAHADIGREFYISSFHDFSIILPSDSIYVKLNLNITECDVDSCEILISIPYASLQNFLSNKTSDQSLETKKNILVSLTKPETFDNSSSDKSIPLKQIFKAAAACVASIHLK